MEKRWLVAGLAVAALALGCSKSGSEVRVDPADEVHQFSYALGWDLGSNLGKAGIAVDPDVLVQALRDAQAGIEPRVDQTTMRQALMREQQKALARRQQEQLAQAKANEAKAAAKLEAAKAFLAENAKQEGVQVTPSGLQYKVIEMGDGPKPGPQDVVTVNYKGMLTDGTVFDSSYERGQPATFPIARVIPGWTEALQLMPVGSKWVLYLPPELAYGARGAGDRIGPNEVLIFEVELLGIGDQKAAGGR